MKKITQSSLQKILGYIELLKDVPGREPSCRAALSEVREYICSLDASMEPTAPQDVIVTEQSDPDILETVLIEKIKVSLEIIANSSEKAVDTRLLAVMAERLDRKG